MTYFKRNFKHSEVWHVAKKCDGNVFIAYCRFSEVAPKYVFVIEQRPFDLCRRCELAIAAEEKRKCKK